MFRDSRHGIGLFNLSLSGIVTAGSILHSHTMHEACTVHRQLHQRPVPVSRVVPSEFTVKRRPNHRPIVRSQLFLKAHSLLTHTHTDTPNSGKKHTTTRDPRALVSLPWLVMLCTRCLARVRPFVRNNHKRTGKGRLGRARKETLNRRRADDGMEFAPFFYIAVIVFSVCFGYVCVCI